MLQRLSSHMVPTCAPSLATFLWPTLLLPACPPKEAGTGSASILRLQSSVILMPHPKRLSA